jgi:hypothetical protein
LVIEFIDKFYDKYDVVSDLRKYLPLFSKDMDAPALAFFIKTERLRLVEEAEESKNQNGTTGRNSVDDYSSSSNSSSGEERKVPVADTEQPVSLKLLRWRFVHHKLNRALGMYDFVP